MKTFKAAFLITAAIVGCVAYEARAQGNSEAIQSFQSTLVAPINNGTIGWAFTAIESIQIDSLGTAVTTTSSNVNVGIWSSNGTLLGSVVVLTNGPTTNFWEYGLLASPVTLAAGGNYIVGASMPGNTYDFLGLMGLTISPSIQWTADATSASGTGFTFPTTGPPVDPNNDPIIGVNFQFHSLARPIIHAALGTNQILLNWNAIAGRQYRVQFVTNLTQTNWANLGGIINATNVTAGASDAVPPAPSRKYYRVVLLP